MNQTTTTDVTKEAQIWDELQSTYEIIESLGKGAYGTVVKAKSLKTGQVVAIKLIQDIQKDAYMMRKVIRELFILRKLSEIKSNVYTT